MADNNDFFDDKAEEVKTEEPKAPEAIKVGDRAYTQEELNRVVQLGEIGKEAEEKYNVKIDKVWPNLQQTINEKRSLEQEIEGLKQAKVATKVEEGSQLTQDELKAQAKVEARNLGLLTVDEVDALVDRRLEAREIRADTQAVVAEGLDKYGIKTDEEALLNHMVETGIRNPQRAFKDLYEDKIDEWKEKQLDSLKKPGMVTDSTSSAGAKAPVNEPVTKANFMARFDEVVDRNQ